MCMIQICKNELRIVIYVDVCNGKWLLESHLVTFNLNILIQFVNLCDYIYCLLMIQSLHGFRVLGEVQKFIF